MARSHTFSVLQVFTSSIDWFTGLPMAFVIGQSGYFGFGFTTLSCQLFYLHFLIIRQMSLLLLWFYKSNL